jgi:DNA-binding MarR family transcriptional regulator
VDKFRSLRKPVSDLQAHLGFGLRFVSNHVSQAFARKLLHSGVTVAEWVILRQMYGGGDMAPSQLADMTGLTRGAASKLVDRLVVKEFVAREERQDDRRYQIVRLTAAGQRLVPKLATIADDNDQQFFAPLSAEERGTLAELLKKLVAAHKLYKIPVE